MSDHTEIVCPSCGIEMWLPEHYVNARRKDGALFYCPNAHAMEYNTNTKAKLYVLPNEAADESANDTDTAEPAPDEPKTFAARIRALLAR